MSKVRKASDEGGGAGEGEARLVRRLQAGEDAAFRELVAQHGGRMLAAAQRILGDRAAAEDCLQEAFLSAFSAIGRFEARAKLGTWLHRITINAALMRLRKEKRARDAGIESLLPDFDADDCRIEPLWQLDKSVEDLLAEDETRKFVQSKIRELPETHRIVLMLRDIEDMDTREAAEVLGITESAVKVRLHRARAALKRLLEPLMQSRATGAGDFGAGDFGAGDVGPGDSGNGGEP